MAKVLDDGLMLTLGVVGVVAAAGAVAGRRGSRAKYIPGHDASASVYVVVNKMSHGSKRLHGPFSSMEEAKAWATAHGEDAVVKTVNLVSKSMDGEFMVIEQHTNEDGSSFEVFFGFFKTASTASRWINRQPDEQTLTDSFVVRVHRAGSAAMHSGSRARESYQAPLGRSYTVVNKTENGIEVFGPFSDKVEAERVSSIFEADDEVRMSYVGIANVVSAKDGKYAVVAEHDEDGEAYEVIYGFFNTESAAEKWMNRQPDEQTTTDVYVTEVFKPKV